MASSWWPTTFIFILIRNQNHVDEFATFPDRMSGFIYVSGKFIFPWKIHKIPQTKSSVSSCEMLDKIIFRVNQF